MDQGQLHGMPSPVISGSLTNLPLDHFNDHVMNSGTLSRRTILQTGGKPVRKLNNGYISSLAWISLGPKFIGQRRNP